MGKNDVIHKPEVHNVLHRRQEDRATSPVTHAENFLKFGCVIFEMCDRADRQTLMAILCIPTEGEVMSIVPAVA